jgi:1,4-alpha-glucan branching enzyme
MNSETSWIWDVIHEDQRRFTRLLPSLSGELGDMLLREMLLEESSDWPFLITTGQARSYGMSRFLDHHRKVRALLAAAEGQPYNAAESEEQPDAVFGHLHLQNLRRPACQN